MLAATDDALAQPQPGADTIYDVVYSPDVDPTSEQFDTEDDPQFSGDADDDGRSAQRVHEGRDAARSRRSSCSARTSPTCRAKQYLGKVKGKGGVFKVTWGLQKEFGGARVYNSPLAEANIVGRAIGLAMRGFKPVVEIQFFDYIWPAYMQLRDELATMRWRSNNDFSVAGGRAHDVRRLHPRRDLSLADGRVAVHALPGPARGLSRRRALDANGLLRTAIRCDDPVIFLEHKHLYRQTYNKARVSRPELHDPVRQGEGRARGHGRHGRHVRRDGAARARGGEPAGGARASTSR